MIREAGAEGASVEIVQTMSEPNASLAVVLQEVLTGIGLDVELRPVSPTESRPLWRQGGQQAMAGPITARFTPSQTMAISYLAQDNPATPLPEIVEMSDAALALPPDSDEQLEAYQELSAYLVENPVHVPLVQFSTVLVSRPNVIGTENLAAATIADLNFRRVGLAQS